MESFKISIEHCAPPRTSAIKFSTKTWLIFLYRDRDGLFIAVAFTYENCAYFAA